MPQTLTGWILLSANFISVFGAANTAGKLVVSLYGGTDRQRFDVAVMLAFIAASFVSDTLLQYAESVR